MHFAISIANIQICKFSNKTRITLPRYMQTNSKLNYINKNLNIKKWNILWHTKFIFITTMIIRYQLTIGQSISYLNINFILHRDICALEYLNVCCRLRFSTSLEWPPDIITCTMEHIINNYYTSNSYNPKKRFEQQFIEILQNKK